MRVKRAIDHRSASFEKEARLPRVILRMYHDNK